MEANLSRTSSLAWVFVALLTGLMLTPLLNAQVQLERLPYSGDVLVYRAIKQGRLQLPSSRMVMDQTRPDVSCNPAPCVFTPVTASSKTNISNENPVAANPANGLNLLSGANDYNCQTTSFVGMYSSSDGGTTWNRICLPGSGGEGDPIVGFDLNGVAYGGGIQSGSIKVASSTNGGMSFGTPKTVTGPLLGYLADKPWLEVDTNKNSSFKNALYVSATQFDFSSNSEISVSHSNDGGNTWTTKAIDTKQIFPNAVDQFSDIAVGSDGTVYVHWLRCPASSSHGECEGQVSNIMFSKSSDGGNTWSTPISAATVTLVPSPSGGGFYGTLPNFNSERVSNIASNAATGSGATARVYLSVYNWTGTQMQVELVTSTDGGATWGAPVIVSAIPKGDQFFQWVNLTSNGKGIAVSWLDRRNDSANKLYQPFFALSTNGGTSFGNAHALSSAKSNPANDGFGGGFMGDYRTHVWNGTTIDAVWMDTTITGNNCQDEFGGVRLR
jgi:hypothetical protein